MNCNLFTDIYTHRANVVDKKKYKMSNSLISRVFAKGSGNRGSIPGRVIPKTQKMIVDAALLNTQHYKVWIEGKVEQTRERSSGLTYTLV